MKTYLMIVMFALPFSLSAQGLVEQHMLPLENDQANQLFEEGNIEEAIKLYQDLYGRQPDNGALAYNLGNAYAATGDLEKAGEFYRKAIQSDHEEARLRSHFNLGNLTMNGQQLDEAVKNYIDYLRERPDDVDAKRNLELALRQMQQQQQQQQQQQNQDQQNQDQQDQEQQQQQQGQSQDEQDQEQNQQQQQQNQDQQQDDQQQQQQNQEQQNQDQQNQSSGEEQQQDQQQQQQQQMQENPEEMSEQTKQQILEALKAQEREQQKKYRERKTKQTKRRAKDW